MLFVIMLSSCFTSLFYILFVLMLMLMLMSMLFHGVALLWCSRQFCGDKMNGLNFQRVPHSNKNKKHTKHTDAVSYCLSRGHLKTSFEQHNLNTFRCASHMLCFILSHTHNLMTAASAQPCLSVIEKGTTLSVCGNVASSFDQRLFLCDQRFFSAQR